MNAVMRLLDLQIPLLQAGMGGVAGPELAAAVVRAGAGGILGLYKHTPDEIDALIRRTADLANAPFGINLVPEIVSETELDARVEVVLDHGTASPFITFFGLAPASTCARIRAAGRPLLVQVGDPASACIAAERGAQALIVQGYGAGGHLLGKRSTAALAAQVRKALPDMPLIAAGEVATGRDLAALEPIGVSAALCGTLFIPAAESLAHVHFKERVVAAQPEDTVVTDLFAIGWPGLPHRVLANQVTRQGKTLRKCFIATNTLLGKPYPVPRFSVAVPTVNTRGRIDEMALYCGVSCHASSAMEPAEAIVGRFRDQLAETRDRL